MNYHFATRQDEKLPSQITSVNQLFLASKAILQVLFPGISQISFECCFRLIRAELLTSNVSIYYFLAFLPKSFISLLRTCLQFLGQFEWASIVKFGFSDKMLFSNNTCSPVLGPYNNITDEVVSASLRLVP